MVCLDTSFIVDLLRRDRAAEKKLEEYVERDEPLTTTPITVAELFEGAYASRRKSEEVQKVREVLEHLQLLELSIPVCEKYGMLVNELKRQGLMLGDLDVLIGSAAAVHREILLTRNKRHFERIPELILDSW